MKISTLAGVMALAAVIAHTATAQEAPSPSQTPTEQPPYARSERKECAVRPGDLIDCLSTAEVFIGSAAGAQQMAQAQLTVNEHFNQLEIIEAANLKADGRRLDVSPDKIIVQASAAEDEASFDADETVRTIIFPDVAPGDRLRYVARYTARRPARPGGFTLTYSFKPEYRYTNFAISLEAPADLKLQTAIKGFTHTQTEKPGRVVHEWRLEPLPYRMPEPDAVSSLDSGPYLQVTSFQDWQSAGDSFCSGAEPMSKVTPEIATLASQITQGRPTRKDQVQAIYDWVASNVRYVSINLGSGGFVPRPAPFIAANRYGDCKDHATLMRALLAARGVDAEYALIDTRPIYKPFSIPLEIYNHVIVHIPELNLYADPTSKHSVFGSLPYGLYDKPALLCGGGKSTVARTPSATAEVQTLAVDAKVAIAPDGRASGETVTSATGYEASKLRGLMTNVETSGAEQIARVLVASQAFNGSARIDPVPSTDRNEPYTVKTAFKFDEQLLGEDKPNTVLTGVRAAGRPFQRMLPIFRAGRIDDFVCVPFTYRERIAYALPGGWAPKSLPRNLTVTSGPASYSANYRWSGASLEVERAFTLRTGASVCPASMAAEMAPAFRLASRDIDEKLTFIPTDPAAAEAAARQSAKGSAAAEEEAPPYSEASRTDCVLRDRTMVDCTHTLETLIGNRSGAERQAEQQAPVNEHFYDMEIVEAANLKADGRRIEVPADKIMTQAKSAGWEAMYEADKTVRTIIFPDVAEGDRLRYVARYRARKPRLPGGVSLAFFNESNSRLIGETISLDAPSDLELNIDAKGYAQTVSEQNGRRRYEWVRQPKPFKSFEYLSTSALDTEPHVLISTFADWNAVGQAFCGPAEQISTVTPEIAGLAEEIAAGKSSRREQAEAIFNWISTKITEVNISLGAGVLSPTDPRVTAKNKYGDNKDVATLTRALLAARGIDAEYVELNHSSIYKPHPIPLQYFDSAILYLPEFNAWVDPTERYSGFGILSAGGYDKPALRCSKGGAQLVRTPPADPETNSMTVTAEVTLNHDGKPSGRALNTATGIPANSLRRYMAEIEKRGVDAVTKPSFDALHSSGSARIVDARPSTDHTEPYAIKFDFSLDDGVLGEDKGVEAITGPVAASPLFTQMASIFQGVRTKEFICHPGSYRESVTYSVPPGWTLQETPKDVRVVSGPAEFTASYQQTPGALQLERQFTLRTKSHVCPASMAEELAPAFRAAIQDVNARLTFVRTLSVTGSN